MCRQYQSVPGSERAAGGGQHHQSRPHPDLGQRSAGRSGLRHLRPADRSPFRRDADCLCRVSVLYARHRMGDPVPAPLSRLHRHYPGRRLPAVHDEVHDDRGGHQPDPGPYLHLRPGPWSCGGRGSHGHRSDLRRVDRLLAGVPPPAPAPHPPAGLPPPGGNAG